MKFLPPQFPHGFIDPFEAGDVGANNIVDTVFCFSIFYTQCVGIIYDSLEFFVDTLARPRVVCSVLRHFKSRDRDATGVGGFAWSVGNPSGTEYPCSLFGQWHVAWREQRLP
jgi:hypothetical protein